MSERANERASGPVLTSRFLADLNHSATHQPANTPNVGLSCHVISIPFIVSGDNLCCFFFDVPFPLTFSPVSSHSHLFLYASSHLCLRVSRSVRPSVCPSVRPSVRHILSRMPNINDFDGKKCSYDVVYDATTDDDEVITTYGPRCPPCFDSRSMNVAEEFICNQKLMFCLQGTSHINNLLLVYLFQRIRRLEECN